MDINELNRIILKNKNTVNVVLPKEKLFNIEKAVGKKMPNHSRYKNKLIHFSNIKEDLYQLDEFKFDYITTSGNIYLYYGNGMFYKRNKFKNMYNGYIYTAVYDNGSSKQRRLHVLLGKTFIPNPYKKYLKIVGHKNDIKDDFDLSNLYWTNNRENTKDASDKGLMSQKMAEDNENSYLVKVLDKNTLKIVGVYGSIRECDRCIENITMSMIAKMCRNKKLYKPRSRKYIYQIATQEEFDQNISLKGTKLIESKLVDKSPKVFYLCNDEIGYKKEFDNQTQASKICGLSQTTISHMIKNGTIYNGWYCIYKDTIKYKDSSSYENMINTIDTVVVQNIYTNEIKKFNTPKELRDELGLSGHDIKHYFKSGNTIMNEWKLINFENKQSSQEVA